MAVAQAALPAGMGAATMSVLTADQLCAMVELHMRFLKPVRHGRLMAETVVVHRGSRVIQLESKVYAGGRELVATGTGSFAVLAKD